MRVYAPLYQHLRRLDDAMWAATFGDVERVLGRGLPASARVHRAWWSNQTGTGHSQARAWREAGWRTMMVDLAAERVEFRRESVSDDGPNVTSAVDLFGEAALVTGIADREALLREALSALVAREHGRSLIALGGSMPDFEAAPRRREA